MYHRVDCGHVAASHPSCLDTHINDAVARKVPRQGQLSERPARRPMRQPFRGPRLTDPIGFWRRFRSSVALVVVSVILGLLVAAILAALVAGIVIAIQNALNAS